MMKVIILLAFLSVATALLKDVCEIVPGEPDEIACHQVDESSKDKWTEDTQETPHEKSVDEILAQILAEIELMKNDTRWTVEYLIEFNGYPVETHHVNTSDGYVLTLHRIPHGKTGTSLGKVAFLQHGLLSSAADWLVAGAGKALGFELADAGYDVWLGNARGNTHSKDHISKNPDESDFWEFSWHEIGTIDVPTMIDYILEQTGVDGIYYAGHSQGTTVYYIMTSSLPQYNKKIKVHASLAPIAYMEHLTSPLLRVISHWTGPIEVLTDMIGLKEFLPSSDFIKYIIGDELCKVDSISKYLCTNSLFAICGFSRDEMNTTLLPIITKYAPAGSSIKQLLHYGQEIRSGDFCQYDFGKIENYQRYGQFWPPSYDLSKITAPTYLYWSKNDWLSAETDVERLCIEMKNACKEKIMVANEKFNHLDYMYGINAKSLVYDQIIALFDKY